MTRVSFYILKGSAEHDRQVSACRLTEKVFNQGLQIYIHAENAKQAEQFNKTLWTFRADSFIPHQLIGSQDSTECQVLIGHNNASPPRLMELLINLSTQQPSFFSQFERVAEFVNDDAAIKAPGRERYRFYKQRGYELNTFKI